METTKTKKITFTQGERVAIANMVDAGGKFAGLRVARGAGELTDLLGLDPDERDNIAEGNVEVEISLEQAQRFIPIADAACRARGLEMAQLAVGFVAKLMAPAPDQPSQGNEEHPQQLGGAKQPADGQAQGETAEEAYRRIHAALAAGDADYRQEACG